MFTGLINNVEFEVIDKTSVNIWLPKKTKDPAEFRDRCQLIIKYLVDEGFLSKKCRVSVRKYV